jgi:hypothetical protein
MTEVGMQHLTRLKNLRRLYLTNTPVGDGAMRHLVQLPKLEEVRLDSTRVTDEAIAFLAQLPNLQEIDLGDTRVTVVGLERFKTALKLRKLRVPSPPSGFSLGFFDTEPLGLTASDLRRLQQALPRCTVTY